MYYVCRLQEVNGTQKVVYNYLYVFHIERRRLHDIEYSLQILVHPAYDKKYARDVGTLAARFRIVCHLRLIALWRY